MTMKLPQLKIGDLTIDVPIIQGGMGVAVSKASLASAVSSEGGLGVIASVGLGEELDSSDRYEKRSQEALRQEIRAVKQKGLPVGVNVMVALTNYHSLVQVCIEENVDAILSGAGLPLRLPEDAGDSAVKLIPIISSGRATEIVCRSWMRKHNRLPDALVVEGPMAGGHLGFKFDDLDDGTAPALDSLVEEVLAVVDRYQQEHGKEIPVIAAGGVYSGQDIARLMNLGASGVQMATRFVATHECDASELYKQAYVNATEEDVALIRSPVGLPARVIKNEFVKASIRGKTHTFACPYKCLLSCDAASAHYCIAVALLNASRGHLDEGFAMCGQNAYRIDKIVSVKELMQELTTEARSYLS